MNSQGSTTLRTCFAVLSLALISLCSLPSFAAMTPTQRVTSAQSGVAYLIFRQNGDGSWGSDNAERLRATNQALWALQSFHVSGIPFNRALNWIYNAQAQSPDPTAHLLLTLSQALVVAPTTAAQLDSMAYVINSGGQNIKQWGAQPNFVPSVLDDIYALDAILLKKFSVDTEVLNYWSILESARNNNDSNGAGFGWGYALTEQFSAKGNRDSAIVPTAEALLAMDKMAAVGKNASYWKAAVADSAIGWLIGKQNADGGFGDGGQSGILSTALAIQAIGRGQYWETSNAAAWQTSIDKAVDYLKAQQQSNGSWLSDVFTTGVAVQAMVANLDLSSVLVDTDSDGLPDTLEQLLSSGQLGYSAPLNSTVADAYLLERSNGENYRDMASGIAISVEFVAGVYDSATFSLPYQQNSTSTFGTWPPGLSFNQQTLTLSGTPSRAGIYTASIRLDYGPNVNKFIPVTIYVDNGDDDRDGDGMPASFEARYPGILNPLDSTDGAKDYDGDGVSNYDEYRGGTDPTNSQDFPVMITSSPPLVAQVGKLYQYNPTANIAGAQFYPLFYPSGMTSNGSVVSWTPSNTQVGKNFVLLIPVVGERASVAQGFRITVTNSPGDINGDGVTDISDLYLIQKHLLGSAMLDTAQLQRADVYPVGQGDGVIDISDLWQIQKIILTGVSP